MKPWMLGLVIVSVAFAVGSTCALVAILEGQVAALERTVAMQDELIGRLRVTHALAVDVARTWKDYTDRGQCHPQILRMVDASRPPEVSVAIWRAVIITESSCLPWRKNVSGAVGLAGVMGGPLDPEANLAEGARRMSHFMRIAGGNLDLALSYYCGWGKRIDTGGIWTLEYARKVQSIAALIVRDNNYRRAQNDTTTK